MITHRAPDEKQTQISSLGRVERRCRALEGVVFHEHFTGWEKTFSSSSYFSLDVRNKWCIRLRDLWPNRVDGACLDGGVLSLLADSRYVESSNISNKSVQFCSNFSYTGNVQELVLPSSDQSLFICISSVVTLVKALFQFNIKLVLNRL